MKGSRLLIDEYPLMFQPSLAVKFGVEEAIFIQQVNYWADIKKKSGDKRFLINGRWWVFNTNSDWQKQFPFWSAKKIYRIVKSCKDQGAILTDKHSKNKSDHTLWYAIGDAVFISDSDFPDSGIRYGQNREKDMDKIGNSDIPNLSNSTYTETTTENTTVEEEGVTAPATASNDREIDISDILPRSAKPKSKNYTGSNLDDPNMHPLGRLFHEVTGVNVPRVGSDTYENDWIPTFQVWWAKCHKMDMEDLRDLITGCQYDALQNIHSIKSPKTLKSRVLKKLLLVQKAEFQDKKPAFSNSVGYQEQPDIYAGTISEEEAEAEDWGF